MVVRSVGYLGSCVPLTSEHYPCQKIRRFVAAIKYKKEQGVKLKTLFFPRPDILQIHSHKRIRSSVLKYIKVVDRQLSLSEIMLFILLGAWFIGDDAHRKFCQSWTI